MKAYLYILIGLSLGLGFSVFALPTYQQTQSLVPGRDNVYDLGTTSPSNRRYNGFFNNLTVSGTCTGCGTSLNATSTEPLMASWFVGTSTTATSTFSAGVSTVGLASTKGLTVTGGATNLTGTALVPPSHCPNASVTGLLMIGTNALYDDGGGGLVFCNTAASNIIFTGDVIDMTGVGAITFPPFGNDITFANNSVNIGAASLPLLRLHARYATTTAIDIFNTLAVGRTATTTIRGDNATSTIANSLSTANLAVTGLTTNRIPFVGAGGFFRNTSLVYTAGAITNSMTCTSCNVTFGSLTAGDGLTTNYLNSPRISDDFDFGLSITAGFTVTGASTSTLGSISATGVNIGTGGLTSSGGFRSTFSGTSTFNSSISGTNLTLTSALPTTSGGTGTSTGSSKGDVFGISTTSEPSWIEPTRDWAYFRQAASTTDEFKIYYGNLHSQTNGYAAVSATTNTFFAYPAMSGPGGYIDELQFRVTTGGTAGSVCRAGIYESASTTGNIYPDALVVDAGEHDTTSAGVKNSVIDVYLKPNRLYWVTLLCGTAAPTVTSGQATSMWTMGINSAMTSNIGGISTTTTYAALPSTYPRFGQLRVAGPAPIVVWHYKSIDVGVDF